MQEKGVDILTEHKVESWKRDMHQELQLMHSQVMRLHNSDEHRSFQDTQKSTINKDFFNL